MAQILIMGATGRIGRGLQQVWAERDDVLWQGRSQAKLPGWIAWQPGDALPRCDSILVLAGVTKGEAAALAQNAVIACDIVKAADAAGVGRVLLASSMAVYGATAPNGATEASPCIPRNAYGQSKLEMEIAALGVCKQTRVTALRIANVVGADMLGVMADPARAGMVRLDRFADGFGPRRSYIGVPGLAQVVGWLAAHPHDLPPVLNIALPQPIAMQDILRHAGIPFDWVPAPETALQDAVMDCGLLRSICPVPDTSAADLVAEWQVLREAMA